MIDLSIVIVNYNVEHFLELCLHSVYNALDGISAEVWVVDNHSSDGSVEMVKTKFPQAFLIANQQNTGFSVANNQAIRKSSGRYVLLLNPDTVVPEHGLKDTIRFMDAHPEAGGLGIRMIDGAGQFLPESKRGLPTPWVSFCKAFGLGSLLPASRMFGQYYLNYLAEDQVHEVDILSGACMLMRKSALEKSGLLDEQFFMYGEDVDLSYRLQLAGYKNFYYPESTIIHFKGESTKRGSISFVMHFYKAMLMFSRKHFSNSALFSLFIYFGIAFRAFLALFQRFIRFFGGFISDFILSYLGMIFIKDWWEINFKGLPGMYPDYFIQMLVPVYLLVWLGGTRIIGRYSERYGHTSIIWGIAVGTLVISGITNFFDDYRFSKGLILIGAVWTYLVATIRYVMGRWIFQRSASLQLPRRKRIMVIGSQNDFNAATTLFQHAEDQMVFAGWVGSTLLPGKTQQLGLYPDIPKLIRTLAIDELMFGLGGVVHAEAIRLMETYRQFQVRYSFLVPGSRFVVSSSEKHNRGTVLQTESIPKILLPYNRRQKRMVDLVGCAMMLFLWPFVVIKGGSFPDFMHNLIDVVKGRKTWIGLANNYLHSYGLKDAVIRMGDLASRDAGKEVVEALDRMYVEEFHPIQEWWNLIKNLPVTGKRQP